MTTESTASLARRAERDFLLASITDLDAEYEAGDLDEHDYRALRADYTARAAAAIRAIEQPRPSASVDQRSHTPRGRRIVWIAGIIVVATLAGVAVASFSGSRSSSDSITGDIRTTTRELLVEAGETFGRGDLPGAISVYDEVLEIQPSNVEALTYRAWVVRLSGDAAAAEPFILDAIAIDPDYPDARVFGAVIALDLGDEEAAVAHLIAFDSLDAPQLMRRLVAELGLRGEIDGIRQAAARAAVEATLLVADPPPLSATDLTVEDVLLAAEALAADDQLFAALELLQDVLLERPDDPDLIAGYGWLVGRGASGEQLAPAEVGLSHLDAALEIDPNHPAALVYRVFVRAFLGDEVGAASDLARFDALATRSGDLVALIDGSPLRQRLG